VLLTTGEAGNSPDCLVSVEGAEVTPDEVARLDRVMILFDGHDEGAKQTAREQWRTLTGAGVAAKYWSEESGRWEMKAESAAS
jgi:DNA polymerase-3 subunit chi